LAGKRASRTSGGGYREEVVAVYEELARRPVERDCRLRTGWCHFRLTGRMPNLTLGEAMFAAEGLRAAGRRRLPEHPDGACPMLRGDGMCMIYEHRPFGCRSHFCREAGGIMPRALVRDLVRRLEDLDVGLGGDGAKGFMAALREVL
jgi:hypothetical protein